MTSGQVIAKIKRVVSGIGPLHDGLQFVFRVVRLVFAQWPLTWYHRLGARFSSKRGVTQEGRSVPVVVSLTTFGKRLEGSVVCIETLLRQSVKPDRLILWLAPQDYESSIPKLLRRLEKRGLEIKRSPNWRSYKKIISAVMESPEAVIVTADDDVFYPRRWLESLLDAHAKEPGLVHCHRSHLVTFEADGELAPYATWPSGNTAPGLASYLVFPTGVGGILYPPGSLDRRVTDHEVFMDLCPHADDIWLKAMALLAGTRCKQTSAYPDRYFEVPNSQVVSLWHTNVDGGANDEQLHRVFSHFHLFDRLREETDTNCEVVSRR